MNPHVPSEATIRFETEVSAACRFSNSAMLGPLVGSGMTAPWKSSLAPHTFVGAGRSTTMACV